jgi:3-oxoacyl-[acyl-carrier protein] reductase
VAKWIVTGGSSGIGLQICRDAAARGHELTIWDIKPPPALDGFAYREVDLTKADAIAAACRCAPTPLECFVHCAGIASSTTITDERLANTMTVAFQVHVLAFVLAVHGLLDRFNTSSASIIAISSAAMNMIYPGTLAYGSSKAAQQRCVSQLAVELGGRGIRVNGIAPGAIATDMTRHLWSDPEFVAQRTRHIPLGRNAEPRAVSDAVLFLASEAAAYVTGETLWVDGGVRHGIFQPGVREFGKPT